MGKIRITQSIFFLVALALIFLFINPPFPDLKLTAQTNLLFIGAAGTIFIMFLQKELKSFEVKDQKDLLGDFAVGTATGVASFIALNFIIKATSGIVNLFGVIDTPTLAAASDSALIFVVEIIPLVETILLVGGTLVLAKLLKNRIPYPKVIAAIAIMFVFAAFHFNVAGKAQFEYSTTGFLNFIGNTQGLGEVNPVTGQVTKLCGVGVQENCISTAFPQFILGGIWIFLALAFSSWVVAWRAHSTVNLISAIMLFGFSSTLLILALLQAGVFLIVASKTKLKEIETFKLRRVLE